MSSGDQRKKDRHTQRVVLMNQSDFEKRKPFFSKEEKKGGIFGGSVETTYWWHGAKVIVDVTLPDGALIIRPKYRPIPFGI